MTQAVDYPWAAIKNERARDYLERIDVDVFNGDATLEDLTLLSVHLAKYVEMLSEKEGK